MSRDLDTTRYSRGQTQDGGSARNIVLGIDIGGTFTDFVAYDKDAKTAIAWKYFSNAEDPATGIFDGLKEFQKPDRVEKIRLGTTIATNAILERKGAVVGYIATKNFTDIPHIGRGDRKGIYDAFWVKPKSLVDRKNCFGVSERISSEGDTLVDLDEKELRKIARKIRDQGNIEVIAVNFLFSYISPKHEKRTKEILAEEVPGMPISISYDVLPKWKEFERSSTTIAEAYVKPIVNDRLPKIIEKIGQLMPNADVTIMKSNGGETTPEVACQQPVQLLLSGPSGGVVATQHLSKTNEIERVMTFDMGGTSTDVAYYAGEYEKGVKQFEIHQDVNSNDVENSVWHFLCVNKIKGFEAARKSLIDIKGDGRVPMAQVQKLFAGKLEPKDVLDAANAGDPSPDELRLSLIHI